MPETSRTPDVVKPSDATRADAGEWRTGWLAVLWEGENYGYADVRIRAGAGAEITFTVYWLDELRPMYRIDVDADGKAMSVLKNYEGWLDEIGDISYDDDGNAVDQDGEPVDPDDVDPFQVVNSAIASDEGAALIASLMQAPPFGVEEVFTRVMAVVGNLTAYTDRWAHRYLRNSTADEDPDWSDLWRPVDIDDGAVSFPVRDADPGPRVRRVDTGEWQGFHLVEDKISAVLDVLGQARPGPFSTDSLQAAYTGEPLSIDDVPDAVQNAWYRIWNTAHITYQPTMS